MTFQVTSGNMDHAFLTLTLPRIFTTRRYRLYLLYNCGRFGHDLPAVADDAKDKPWGQGDLLGIGLFLGWLRGTGCLPGESVLGPKFR
jgi:hypothetical protein